MFLFSRSSVQIFSSSVSLSILVCSPLSIHAIFRLTSLTIIQVGHAWVPPKRSKTTPFSIVSAPFSIVSAPFSIVSDPFPTENGAETKHLNSTRTARPPKGPGSWSRIQMLKSSVFVRSKISKDRLRREDRFRPKIVKIRAILAIFRPFENFCEFRFDRFDIPFDSIDIATEGHGGPPW